MDNTNEGEEDDQLLDLFVSNTVTAGINSSLAYARWIFTIINSPDFRQNSIDSPTCNRST